MGLSQRKDKQKIGADPRNLQWSNDQSKFAFKHMTSLGWAPSTGLGSTVVGNPNHIAVARKLDSHGIGVDRAMREGKDVEGSRAGEGLESVLQRLRGSGGGSPIIMMIDDEEETPDASSPAPADSVPLTLAPSPAVIISPIPVPFHHPLASRQKHIRSKRMLASSPAAMAEILGIPLSSMPSSPAGSGASTPVLIDKVEVLPVVVGSGSRSGTATPTLGSKFRPSGSGIGSSSSGVPTPIVSVQPILDPSSPSSPDGPPSRSSPPPTTTSLLSVSDYFRQKLAQKKAQREGRPVPEMQYGRRDLGAGGGENSVAKEFEGKRVVFGDNVEAMVDGQQEAEAGSSRAEASVGGEALLRKPKKEKKEKKDRSDKEDKGEKGAEEIKKDKKDKKTKEDKKLRKDKKAKQDHREQLPLAVSDPLGTSLGEPATLAGSSGASGIEEALLRTDLDVNSSAPVQKSKGKKRKADKLDYRTGAMLPDQSAQEMENSRTGPCVEMDNERRPVKKTKKVKKAKDKVNGESSETAVPVMRSAGQ